MSLMCQSRCWEHSSEIKERSQDLNPQGAFILVEGLRSTAGVSILVGSGV